MSLPPSLASVLTPTSTPSSASSEAAASLPHNSQTYVPTAATFFGSSHTGSRILSPSQPRASGDTRTGGGATPAGSPSNQPALSQLQIQQQQVQAQTQQQLVPGAFGLVGDTPGRFALQQLYNKLIENADHMIKYVVNTPLEQDVNLGKLLQFGAHEFLDQLIMSLGRIGKHCAAQIIEMLIEWRALRIKEFDVETARAHSVESHSKHFTLRELVVLLTERRSLVAEFIFCRTLIELLRNVKEEQAVHPIYQRLEELALVYVKSAEPEVLARNRNKQLVHDLYAELLGAISIVRFQSVTDKMLEEIKILKETKVERSEMLIKSMRFFVLKINTMSKLEESADFLETCGKYFQEAHHTKHVYAELLTDLLAPIGESIDIGVNVPKWVSSIDDIWRKSMKMIQKPKHFHVAMPLLTNVLFVSTKLFFLANWITIVDHCRAQFRAPEEPIRVVAVECLSRLVWKYLFNFREPDATALEKISKIYPSLFPQGKRFIIPNDTNLEHFWNIIYYISMRNLDYGMKNIIFMLLNSDQLSSSTKDDAIFRDRVIVAIKAFLLVLGDLEKKEKEPAFPWSGSARPSTGTVKSKRKALANNVAGGEPEKTGVEVHLVTFNKSLGYILSAVDGAINTYTNRNEKYNEKAGGKPPQALTEKYTQQLIDVVKEILRAIPRCFPTADLDEMKLYCLIANLTTHLDTSLAKEASDAIKRIAEQCPDRRVPLIYALGNQFLLTIPDRLTTLLYQSLDLYSVCLSFVLPSDIVSNSNASSSVTNLPQPGSTVSGPLRMIEDAERIGLLLCCHINAAVRTLAIKVIRAAGDLGRKVQIFMSNSNGNPSSNGSGSSDSLNATSPTPIRSARRAKRSPDLILISQRVIHIMDDTGLDAIDKIMAVEFEGKESPPTFKSFEELAGVDAPSQQVLWIKVLCEMMKRVIESCEGPVSRCWPDIAQRLQDIIPSLELSIQAPVGTIKTITGFVNSQTKLEPPTDERVAQFQNYLYFMCCTASKPGDALVSPSKKIQTARDLFRVVLNLLKSDRDNIVNAVVGSLGVTNSQVFKALLDVLHPVIKDIYSDDASRKRNIPRKAEGLRVEISRIYYLTGDYFKKSELLEDEALMQMVIEYINLSKAYLDQPTGQNPAMRRDFCGFIESLYNNISPSEKISSRYFPPKMRENLYSLFQNWCANYGLTASTSTVFNLDKANAAMSDVRQLQHSPSKDLKRITLPKEAVDAVDIFMQQQLELAAYKAMAALCKGRLIVKDKRMSRVMDHEDSSFTFGRMFDWVNSLFKSANTTYHVIAKSALESLLFYNEKEQNVLDTVITECYTGPAESPSTRGYFLALVDVFIRKQNYPCHLPTILNLILFKTADPDQYVRKSAVQLLQLIEERFFMASLVADYSISLTSSLPTTYKQSQQILSARLAQDHVGLTTELLCEMTRRVTLVPGMRQRDMLTIVLPWIGNLKSLDNSSTSWVILTNLFFLTVKFGDEYVKEIESLWVKLTEDSPQNVVQIVSFLLKTGLSIRNVDFASHAKKVIVYIGRTRVCKNVINCLVEHIVPDLNMSETVSTAFTMAPASAANLSRAGSTEQLTTVGAAAPSTTNGLYMASLTSVLPTPDVLSSSGASMLGTVATSASSLSTRNISKSELAFILLVDLTIEISEEIRRHLPLLLHVAFLNMDHTSSHVLEQSRLLFINLVHSLAVKIASKPEHVLRATNLISVVSEKEGKVMWTHEERDLKTARCNSEADLGILLQRTLDVFLFNTPDLRQQWASVALTWTTTCPFQHLANRSAQILRALKPTLMQQMLADILTRLSEMLSSTRDDSQIFALELLITVEHFIDSLENSKLILFPQLFWASVAILQSNIRHEFVRGIKMLSHLLDRIDITDESVRNVLMSNLPLDWQPPFTGIQPLVLKGLQADDSDATVAMTIQFLTRLCAIKPDTFVDTSEARVLYTILASLPYLHIHAGEPADHPSHVYVNNIAQLCENKQLVNLSKWFKTFQRKRVFSEDTLKQLVLAIKEAFFPTYEVAVLQFLLDLVDFGPANYKRPVLVILRAAVTSIGLSSSSSSSVNHDDLIGPVFRLLNSEFVEEALLILDHTVSIASSGKASIAHSPSSATAVSATVGVQSATAGGATAASENLWTGRSAWWLTPESTQLITRQKLGNVIGSKSNKRRSKLLTEEEIQELFSSPEVSSALPHMNSLTQQFNSMTAGGSSSSAATTDSPKLTRSASLERSGSNDPRALHLALASQPEMMLPSPVSNVPSTALDNLLIVSSTSLARANADGQSETGEASLSLSSLPTLGAVRSDSGNLDLAMSAQPLSIAVENSKRNTLRRSKSAPPAMRAASKWFVDLLNEPLSYVVLQIQMKDTFNALTHGHADGKFEVAFLKDLANALNLPLERLEFISLEAAKLVDLIDEQGRPQPPPSPHGSLADNGFSVHSETQYLSQAQQPQHVQPRNGTPSPNGIQSCIATVVILSTLGGSKSEGLVAAEELGMLSSKRETNLLDKLKDWIDVLNPPAVFVASAEKLYPYVVNGVLIEPPATSTGLLSPVHKPIDKISPIKVGWALAVESWLRWFECFKQSMADTAATDVPSEFKEGNYVNEPREQQLLFVSAALFPKVHSVIMLLRDDFKMALELRLGSLSAKAVVVQNTIAHLLKLLGPLMSNYTVAPLKDVDASEVAQCVQHLDNARQTKADWFARFQSHEAVIGGAIASQMRTYIYERTRTNDLVLRDDSDQQNRYVSVALCNQATHFVRLLQYVISFHLLVDEGMGAGAAGSSYLQTQHSSTVRFLLSIATYTSELLAEGKRLHAHA